MLRATLAERKAQIGGEYRQSRSSRPRGSQMPRIYFDLPPAVNPDGGFDAILVSCEMLPFLS